MQWFATSHDWLGGSYDAAIVLTAASTGVAALPKRGDGELSPAIWRTEVSSLLEDVAAATVGARQAEAALRWTAGLL